MPKPFEPFEVFEVTLLQDLQLDDDELLVAGTKAYGTYPPHGRIYLSGTGKPGSGNFGPVAFIDAKLGEHFAAEPQVEDRLWKTPLFVADPTTVGLWNRKPGV